ncbi:hypothetical protein Psed_2020 [Pseudonocardia dioxanivorans CB1190]|uniref:Uncharacterized protein n=1 Tax=Pseudonocardia dioxanivorans (strain ATCC 55486 / DSM 44775 / JCM 13855 / CB1190) TaxID=675635 RepID=F4CWZ2_PSEUX|nr:hypothetical protein Psed_2020 [Pseudonocardia dioxanivorans CB1190]
MADGAGTAAGTAGTELGEPQGRSWENRRGGAGRTAGAELDGRSGRAALPRAARPCGVCRPPADCPGTIRPRPLPSGGDVMVDPVPGEPPRCCPPARQEELCRIPAADTTVLARHRGWC